MHRKLFALAFLFAVAAHAQLSDQQIVDNAFPATLDDGPLRFSRFIVVDLNHNGQPLLAAVYTNGAAGAIRVLSRAGQVLAATALPGMRAFHASVRAVDVDADGTPELIAEFTSGHSPDNADTWVFRWTGNALQLLSPICPVRTLGLTCLGRVTLIDLTGDGHLSLLEWPTFTVNAATGGVTCDGNWTLYTLKNGVYQKASQTFQFAREFHRGTGEPFTSDRKFAATPGATTLRVVNGTGAAAATSAHVLLNGKEVVGPDDFKRKQHVYDVAVDVLSQNRLVVRLDGAPGATIIVLILGSTTAP